MRCAAVWSFLSQTFLFYAPAGFAIARRSPSSTIPLSYQFYIHTAALNQISGKPFETLSYRTQLMDKVYFRSMVFEVWNVFQIWTWNFNTLQNTLQRGFKNRAFTNLQPYSRVNVKVEHRPYLFYPDGIKREHASKQFSLNHIKEALFPLFSIRYPNWITL